MRFFGLVFFFEGGMFYLSVVVRSGCLFVLVVFLLFLVNVFLEMVVVFKGRKIVNDIILMMCIIEGIVKKEYVVRNKFVFFVCIVGIVVNVLFYVFCLVIML